LHLHGALLSLLRFRKILAEAKRHFSPRSISGNWERRDEMIEKANGRVTVPQVFIGDLTSEATKSSKRSTGRASLTNCSETTLQVERWRR
jgi:hypothetical protein